MALPALTLHQVFTGSWCKAGMQSVQLPQQCLMSAMLDASAAMQACHPVLFLSLLPCFQIPEGICVAMPIYYSTGSKWKVSAAVSNHPVGLAA